MDDAAPVSDSAAESHRHKPAKSNTLRRFVVWSFIGGALGLAFMLVALRQANYDPTPTLTSQAFEAAYERWQSQTVPDYDIEIRVTGPQAAIYRVNVRNNEPTAAWRNGKPLTTRRTFGTWSVPGMFSTISRDMTAVEQAAAQGKPAPLILRAAFNVERGYPERYQRIDNGSRRGSDSIAVTWDVVAFNIVHHEPANRASGENDGDADSASDP